jgi:hypothetical protein
LEERAKKEDVGKVKKGPGGHQIAGNRNTWCKQRQLTNVDQRLKVHTPVRQFQCLKVATWIRQFQCLKCPYGPPKQLSYIVDTWSPVVISNCTGLFSEFQILRLNFPPSKDYLGMGLYRVCSLLEHKILIDTGQTSYILRNSRAWEYT